MTQATNMAGKSTNRFGMYAQQVGYQVGDFFVQVQSGTSALVAFGQQGTQLAGLLPGLAGAVIGISLAIGTMLLRSFMETRKATKDAAAGFVDYEASLKSAKEETKSMSEELMVLEGNFRSVAHAALDKALRDAEAALDKAEKAEVKTTRLSPVAREAGLKLLRDAVQVAQDNLDKHLELNTTLSKTNSLEESRLEGIKLFYKYRQRDLEAAEELAKAVEKIKKATEKANQSARDRLLSEGQKISLLEAELEFGKESVRYKNLVALIEDSNLRRKLETQGVEKATIDAIINQLDVQREITAELEKQGRITYTMFEGSAGAIAMRKYGSRGTPTGTGEPSTKTTKPTKEPVVKESDLQKLETQLKLERALVGQTEARQRVIQALGVKFVEDNPKTVAGLEKQINKNLELVRVEQERIDLANTIGSAMEDSLMSMVDGTKSVKDAFRDMARDIVRHLYKVLVVQQMINAIGGMMSGSSNASIAKIGGALESYDNGGYTGNGPRSGGLDGKGGFMAMMHPRETVVDHTKPNSGGTGQNVVINQSFNFQANGDDSVKKIIAQAAPQIANMTKKSMLDDRRRGGTTKAVFG
jgi:hypothetical protein